MYPCKYARNLSYTLTSIGTRKPLSPSDVWSLLVVVIVRLSLLRKIILNPGYYMFMYECVIKQTLALNCRLQIEQVNTDCNDSDDDPLAFSLLSLRFLSAPYVFFVSS